MYTVLYVASSPTGQDVLGLKTEGRVQNHLKYSSQSNQYSIRMALGIWRLCCANLLPLPMSILTK
eukprot:1147818-Pelagomonas_calceolata.AAC.2